MGKRIFQAAAAAVRFARQVGNDLYPQFQAGLQDAQNLATRMTLDQQPGASVPGQAGVSTQRELYELSHDLSPAQQAEPSAPAGGVQPPQFVSAEVRQEQPEDWMKQLPQATAEQIADFARDYHNNPRADRGFAGVQQPAAPEQGMSAIERWMRDLPQLDAESHAELVKDYHAPDRERGLDCDYGR